MGLGKKWSTMRFSFRTITINFFVLYFNDLADNVACEICYDTKIYSTIKDISDTFLLQTNLDVVNEWSHKWLLKFNVNCYSLVILVLLTTIYLIRVTEEKDLGVYGIQVI